MFYLTFHIILFDSVIYQAEFDSTIKFPFDFPTDTVNDCHHNPSSISVFNRLCVWGYISAQLQDLRYPSTRLASLNHLSRRSSNHVHQHLSYSWRSTLDPCSEELLAHFLPRLPSCLLVHGRYVIFLLPSVDWRRAFPYPPPGDAFSRGYRLPREYAHSCELSNKTLTRIALHSRSFTVVHFPSHTLVLKYCWLTSTILNDSEKKRVDVRIGTHFNFDSLGLKYWWIETFNGHT